MTDRRTIRTMLFVPGDRPDRIPKAAAHDPDVVAIDLEDAVALSRKDDARASAASAIEALPPSGPRLAVRVNGIDSGMMPLDVDALAPVLRRIDFLILPMAGGPSHVEALAHLIDRAESASGLPQTVGIMPLIETAAGVLDAPAIAAAHPRVVTLTFGPADLSKQLGVVPTPEGSELRTARSLVVLAAAAAGLIRPVDGPYLDLTDVAGQQTSSQRAKLLGFGGQQVLHPRQLPIVRAAFAPDADEIAWATRVDRAFSEAEARGVASIRLNDGTFVDYPVADRARAILRDASR